MANVERKLDPALDLDVEEPLLQGKKQRLTVYVPEGLLAPFSEWAERRYPGTRDAVARGISLLLLKFYRQQQAASKE